MSPGESPRSPDTPRVFVGEKKVYCPTNLMKEVIWINITVVAVNDAGILRESFPGAYLCALD